MPVLYTTGEKVFKIRKRNQIITKTMESKNGESNSPVYMLRISISNDRY